MTQTMNAAASVWSRISAMIALKQSKGCKAYAELLGANNAAQMVLSATSIQIIKPLNRLTNCR